MSMFIKQGEQLLLRETRQPVRLLFVENFGFAQYPSGEMLKFLDAIAASKANGIRVFGFFPFGKGRQQEIYVREGGRYDRNRVNLDFVNYLRQWVGYAQQRGIVVLYELFDSVGLKYREVAPYHPLGDFTNGDVRAFSDLANHRMVAAQKKYLDDVVNVLKQFPNVIFAIMNEFDGNDNWHYEMSRHVKQLAPNHLTAGSAEHSTAIADSHVDIWFSHSASYDRDNCRSNVARDMADMRPRTRGKIVGYSTDGFGSKGMKCENPDAMRALAQDARAQNLQLLSFLDHFPYVDFDPSGKEYPLGGWLRQADVYELSQARRANTQTYAAMAAVFQPTPLATTTPPAPVELPKGMFHAFEANTLSSTHPNVISEKGGKAVAATTTQGYLCMTAPISNLPAKALQACWSVFVDNNTADDSLVLIVDAYDTSRQRVIAKQAVSRKDFSQAQTFTLLKLPFTPQSDARLEFRVYYFGFAYIAIDKMAVIDPAQIALKTPADIPAPGTIPPPPQQKGLIQAFDVSALHHNHPDVFLDRGGKAIRATTTKGFLAFGQMVTGYPAIPLDVYFSLFIDNNTADNVQIIGLDVYDSYQKKLLADVTLTRQQFPAANAFTLFKLRFTPVAQSKLEFRIYYHGYSYVAADKIAVVDPAKATLTTYEDLIRLITGANPPPPPPPDRLVAESLKDGQTTGQLIKAALTPQGVQFQGGDGAISYVVPSLPRGFVEFSARGFTPNELHGGNEFKSLLLSMWDADKRFDYDNDAYIFELRKYGYIEGRKDATDTLWFKIKSNGEWTENPRAILTWDQNTTYRFRLEWGGGATRILRDGQETARGVYRAEFAPPKLRIQIGANALRARVCPHNLVISDVVIGKL